MCQKIMIWANVTKFGQIFITLQIFLAGTPMEKKDPVQENREPLVFVSNFFVPKKSISKKKDHHFRESYRLGATIKK